MPSDKKQKELFTLIITHDSELWTVAIPVFAADAYAAMEKYSRPWIIEADGKPAICYAAEELAVVAVIKGHHELESVNPQQVCTEPPLFKEHYVQITDVCQAMIDDDAPLPPLASFKEGGANA